MNYLQAKSDLAFVRRFSEDVPALLSIEAKAAEVVNTSYSLDERQKAIRRAAAGLPGYTEIRDRVARGQLRAMRLAYQLGVPADFYSLPAPAVGGAIIEYNLFLAILHDPPRGRVEPQRIYDTLNQLAGEAEDRLAREKRRLLNPLNWIKEALVFVIRVPFMLIEASGFDVSKVEDNLLAKVFKLAEIIFLLLILYRLGVDKTGLRDALLKLFLAK